MIASAPPLTPPPNCRPSNSSIASDLALLAKNLAMRRRKTLPTATGRTPPFFLDKDVSESRHSALEIKAGESPATKVYKLCYRFQSKLFFRV